jgi:hypothetical protein
MLLKIRLVLMMVFMSVNSSIAQYGSNLVINPDAENGFTGWARTDGGSGWGLWGSAGSYAWGSSYNWGTLEQTIDLISQGYQGSALDAIPNILVGVEVSNSGNGGAYAVQYEFKADLLNSSDVVVASWTTGIVTTASNTPGWVPLSHTFSSYAPGVRKVKITLSGQDYDVNWAGQYGAGFDNANVQIDGSLPVELTSFTANANSSVITLNWKTATEINNYGFEVERRAVSSEQFAICIWQKIGFVKGAGTSNAPKEYSYSDATDASGSYVYRLKQIDVDGSFKYSQSVEVSTQAPKQFILNQNYPNPFNPTTMIRYQLPIMSNVTLKVYDVLGKEVATLVNETKEAGSYTAQFNASQYSSGVYFFKLTMNQFSSIRKMTLMK